MLYLYMSFVYTYHCSSVSKNIFFWCGCCFLLIFVAKKAAEGTQTSIFMYQGSVTFQGGRVEDHRMMFMRHLHLLQSHIQVKLYI